MAAPQRYDLASQYVHWLVAALVIAMLAMGLSLEYIPDEWRKPVMLAHKSTGVVIFGLTALRLVWWALRPIPAPLAGSKAQKVAANLVHGTLYLMLLALPFTGLAMASAAGRPVSFYGLAVIPPLLPENELMDTLVAWHGWLAYVLMALIGLHLLATLYHTFIRKDGILKRMTD